MGGVTIFQILCVFYDFRPQNTVDEKEKETRIVFQYKLKRLKKHAHLF